MDTTIPNAIAKTGAARGTGTSPCLGLEWQRESNDGIGQIVTTSLRNRSICPGFRPNLVSQRKKPVQSPPEGWAIVTDPFRLLPGDNALVSFSRGSDYKWFDRAHDGRCGRALRCG
jgi:hypothetical protein